LIITESTSPSAVESVAELASERPEAKFVPKIENREPGAIVVVLPNPAALPIPPCPTTGIWDDAIELSVKMQTNSDIIRGPMIPCSQNNAEN
jgi:hypothetical protein